MLGTPSGEVFKSLFNKSSSAITRTSQLLSSDQGLLQRRVRPETEAKSSIEHVSQILDPHLGSKKANNSLIQRGKGLHWLVGPAYVESVEQMLSVASHVADLGTGFIRTRAYWPEAKEADFQRHLVSGLKVLKATAKHFDLQVVSEIVHLRDLKVMCKYCDVIEVGPSCAGDLRLLSELGYTEKTVILSRHPMMRTEHFLSSIESLERGACCDIVLAEHGVQSFESVSQKVFDLSSIMTLRRHTNYPILVDCSHLAEDAGYTEQLAVTAIAAGADGVLAELNDHSSRSYHPNSFVPLQLQGLMQRADALKHTLNALMHHRYSHRE